MNTVSVDSPLAGGPSQIFVREAGAGVTIVHLHGGWGYDVYPLEPAEMPGARFVIPDRTGYGRSTPLADLPPDFHDLAARETERVLDALGIERCVLWGHSDGAVIAVKLGLRDPGRYEGLVLEALHRDRTKLASRAFFTDMAEDPTRFGPRLAKVLEGDHGARWQAVLRMGGRAWLAIAEAAAVRGNDLYDGALPSLAPPTLVLHGDDDPRTEPGELAAIHRDLQHQHVATIANGGHCPHAHRDPQVRARTYAAVTAFVAQLRSAG